MKKTVQVHMLPTADNLQYPFIAKNMEIGSNRKILLVTGNSTNSLDYQPQHLYFTSDEELVNGDYCIGKDNRILKCIENNRVSIQEHWRKIVATTDRSLFETIENHNDFDSVYHLPRIPKSFIKQYVKANGKIDKVEIELDCYEDRQCECNNNSACLNIGIKVDSHNRVIVHYKQKKFYTIEEVNSIKLKYFEAGRKLTQAGWEKEDWQDFEKLN